jgi:hypothetical protein
MLRISYGDIFERRCSRIMEFDKNEEKSLKEITKIEFSMEQDIKRICKLDKYEKREKEAKIIIGEINNRICEEIKEK